MKSFAEELDRQDISIGIESGKPWVADGDGNEPKVVGCYTIAQTNAGPDIRSDGGDISLVGFDPSGEQVTAIYRGFDGNEGWEDVGAKPTSKDRMVGAALLMIGAICSFIVQLHLIVTHWNASTSNRAPEGSDLLYLTAIIMLTIMSIFCITQLHRIYNEAKAKKG
jgi:hypothetical protein